MPELPEVELVRRRMHAEMAGMRIDQVTVHDDAILEGISPTSIVKALKGRHVKEVLRRGKQLLCVLDDGSVMATHLGMTGDVEFSKDLIEHRHLRFSLVLSNGTHMHFIDQRKFGSVGRYSSVEALFTAKKLGPDALDISAGDFAERVSAHHKAIKTTLLDQGVLAGVGNLYSDEMLYQCRIHPEIRADTLPSRKLHCLHRAMRDILQRSIDSGSDFDLLPGRYLLHDRRTGSKCPRCRTLWTTLTVNGRTAYLCPRCQRETRNDH